MTYALPHFNPKLSSAHTYFTTVIHNTCRTYLRKEARHDNVDIDEVEIHCDTVEHNGILTNLVERNKLRFRSIQNIGDITLWMYDEICDGVSKRIVLRGMVCNFQIANSLATTIYESSVVYLRGRYQEYARKPDPDAPELSLLSDLRETVGVENYQRILLEFSGLSIKIP